MDLMASLKRPFHIYRLCGGRGGLFFGGGEGGSHGVLGELREGQSPP